MTIQVYLHFEFGILKKIKLICVYHTNYCINIFIIFPNFKNYKKKCLLLVYVDITFSSLSINRLDLCAHAMQCVCDR